MKSGIRQFLLTTLTALMVAAQCVVPSAAACGCGIDSTIAVEEIEKPSCCSASTQSCCSPQPCCGGTSECTCSDQCGKKRTDCQCGCSNDRPPEPTQQSVPQTEIQTKVVASLQNDNTVLLLLSAADAAVRLRSTDVSINSSSVQALLCTWQT